VKIRTPGPAASQVAPAQPPPAQAPTHIPPQPKAPQAPPQQPPPQQNNLAQIWPLLIKKLADSNQLDQVASDITRLLQAGADSEKVRPSVCKFYPAESVLPLVHVLQNTRCNSSSLPKQPCPRVCCLHPGEVDLGETVICRSQHNCTPRTTLFLHVYCSSEISNRTDCVPTCAELQRFPTSVCECRL
jgi:hypothetical protein